jgi:flagellar biosynthesis regulator FlaF
MPPKVPKEQVRSTRERARRLVERSRELVDKARNTAQVSVFRREVSRLEGKKKK